MKKYKLVKTYPSFEKLNAIAYKSPNEKWYKVDYVMPEDSNIPNFTRILFGHKIEDNPEYWEEVVEKDYEILSLQRKSTKEIVDVNKNCKVIDLLIDNMPHNNLLIYSVKRLSDNTVFTVGDKLETGIIKEFYLPSGVQKEVTIYVTKDNEDTYLSEAKHIKKPLFKTFDNVDIYEGDKYYWISDHSGIHVNKFACSLSGTLDRKYFYSKQAAKDYINSKKVLFTTEDGVDIRKGDKFFTIRTSDFKLLQHYTVYSDDVLHFSTKEAAENFIILNKPCLSLNDVGQFYKKLLDFSNGNSKGLLKLVKSKL